MKIKAKIFRFFAALLVLILPFSFLVDASARAYRTFSISARSAVIMDANTGAILYAKNPHLRLPPASTTKVMTVMIVLDKLPLTANVVVGVNASNAAPSKAGLVAGVRYNVRELVTAVLVSSSNDAAIALAEAVSGNEASFVELMNEKALKFGMRDTHFINATGLPSRDRALERSQFSTAYDLSRLMWYASRDARIDGIMAITDAAFRGSDGRQILLRSHNKMLWKTPGMIKGKTGWTIASRHTFMGTNYTSPKLFTFAMLSSRDPWMDIKRLANFGSILSAKNHF